MVETILINCFVEIKFCKQDKKVFHQYCQCLALLLVLLAVRTGTVMGELTHAHSLQFGLSGMHTHWTQEKAKVIY